MAIISTESSASGPVLPTGNARTSLVTTLEAYRKRIGRDRRAGFLSIMALFVGAIWIAAALLLYFGAVSTLALLAAPVLTVVLAAGALVLEVATRPSLAQTARLLDARLDDRQRLVTALELEGRPQPGPLDAAQIVSTSCFIANQNPRVVWPIRSLKPAVSLSLGLICFALALLALKDTGAGFVPYAATPLTDTPQTAASMPSPTAASGLPGSDLVASPTPTPSSQNAQASQPQPSGTAQSSSSSQSGVGDPAQSKDAQANLQNLADALNGQSAAQNAADNLRNGNYNQASKDIADLGTQNDQLSARAKKDLAQALDKAASGTTDDNMRYNEQSAADALRQGDYKNIADSMNALGSAVQDTSARVMSQQELAKAYPSPTAPAAASAPPQDATGQSANPSKQDGSSQAGQNGQPGQNSPGESQQQTGGDTNGQSGQKGQNGQNSQGSGQQAGGKQSGQQAGSSAQQSGQSGEDSQSGQSGQRQSGQNGQEGQQGNGSTGGGQDQNGEGKSGSPGEGHRESGPAGANLQGGTQNPFELQGAQPQQPSSPGDGSRPAITLQGKGAAGGTAPVAPGSAGSAPAESGRLPVERWDVLQRYFGSK